MSERLFSVSIIASAVMLMLTPSLSHANTVTEDIERKSSSVDLTQSDIQVFHYRNSSNALAQTGVTVQPAQPHKANAISVRGASNGAVLTQDNIFYSPAPYSGQNLVLQPNLFFHHSISASKQTSVINGGQGAFGVVDFSSVQISEQDVDTVINAEVDEDGSPTGGLVVSGTTKEFGLLLGVDYSKAQTEAGISTAIDNEYDKMDILFKVDADSLKGARNPQRTEFSYHYTDSRVDNSKLGLLKEDFDADPLSRYSASAKDYEEGKRQRYALAHEVNFSGNSAMFTDIYYQTLSQGGHDAIVFDPSSPIPLYQIATFEKFPTDTGLNIGGYQHDNDFSGFGIQSKGLSQYGAHEVVYFVRYHSDKAEVRALEQGYLLGQDLMLSTIDDSMSAFDYTDRADALTTAVDAKLNYDKLSINIGLSFESVNVERQLGSNADFLTAVDEGSDGWTPAIEVAYSDDNWKFAASAKQAWTAAGAGNLERLDQEALQYQLAFLYQQNAFNLSTSVYMHDYDNMHVTCGLGATCSPQEMATQSNLKDVSVVGADFTLGYRFDFNSFAIPLGLNYSYTQAEFGESRCSSYFGCYIDGNQLPWVPENQLSANIGLVIGDFTLGLTGLYQSELGQLMTVDILPIDSQFKLDLAAQYEFNQKHQVYVRVENLLDEELVARHNMFGYTAQSDLTTYLGYQGRF